MRTQDKAQPQFILRSQTRDINRTLVASRELLHRRSHVDKAYIAVIVEATYGVSKHLPREDREIRFVKRIRNALERGGKVLLPVVALGRAQVLNFVSTP